MRTASSQFLRARAAFSLAVYVAVCVAISTAVCTSAISCAPTRRNATTTKKPTPETRNGRVTATLGLELVRWFVAIDPKARRSALRELEESGELVRIPSPLARDGVLLFRVKAASVPSIAAASFWRMPFNCLVRFKCSPSVCGFSMISLGLARFRRISSNGVSPKP